MASETLCVLEQVAEASTVSSNSLALCDKPVVVDIARGLLPAAPLETITKIKLVPALPTFNSLNLEPIACWRGK